MMTRQAETPLRGASAAMRRVLVIGATGLLGGAAVRGLCPSFPLAALRHRNTPAADGLEVRDADLFDPGSLRSVLEDVQTILFFPSFSTPLHAPLDPRHEIETTVKALTNVLAAASEIDTRPHVLFASTAGAMYGETPDASSEDTAPGPINSYGLGKQISEEIIAFYSRIGKITHTILRFSNLYGSPVRRMVKQGAIDIYLDDALAGDVSTVWAAPSSTRDYLLVDDAARAIEATLRSPAPASNATFNVSSGVTTSMASVLEIVGRVTEGRHRYNMAGRHAGGPRHTRIDSSRFRDVFPDCPAPIPVEAGVRLAWKRKLANREGPLAIGTEPARVSA